jgi:hypothetical protein
MITRYFIFSAVLLSLCAPASEATQTEWGFYEKNPTLLLKSMQLLKRNVRNISDLLRTHQIPTEQNALQKIYDRIPDQLSGSTKKDFETLVGTRAEFQTLVTASGIGQLLVEHGIIAPEILNWALISLPDEIAGQVKSRKARTRDPRSVKEWTESFRELAKQINRNRLSAIPDPRLLVKFQNLELKYLRWADQDFAQKAIFGFGRLRFGFYIAISSAGFLMGTVPIFYLFCHFNDRWDMGVDAKANIATSFTVLSGLIGTGLAIKAFQSFLPRLEFRVRGYKRPREQFWKAIARTKMPFPQRADVYGKNHWLAALLSGKISDQFLKQFPEHFSLAQDNLEKNVKEIEAFLKAHPAAAWEASEFSRKISDRLPKHRLNSKNFYDRETLIDLYTALHKFAREADLLNRFGVDIVTLDGTDGRKLAQADRYQRFDSLCTKIVRWLR